MTATSLPEIRRFADPSAVAVATSAFIATRLENAMARRGHASIALSGGSTPRAMHRLLATRALDWSRVRVYFGDERCVAPDNPASNFRMAREDLLDHVPAQVHRIEGERSPADAASRYSQVIAAAVPFDVICLGMGDDGHTASLFPGLPELPPGALVVATRSPLPPTDRVTLTYHALAAASMRVLQVCGASKAARLAEVHAELVAGRPTLPTARIGPAIWMIDHAAAAQLPPRERNGS